MPTKITIDPVTRLEGHLKIQVTVDMVAGKQQVVDAQATGTLFRGFEQILINRDPQDAPDITQRICGVCPVSHGTAASLALEACAGLVVPNNARLMRNLVLGANFVQSHILHFYHLALLDFVEGPAMPPWQPSWKADKGRFAADETTRLVNNYVQALNMRRKAHEMGALFGGRLPHPPSFVPGGFTTTPRATRISKFRTYLSELTAFIRDVYIPDSQLLAIRYPEYYGIGKGYGNLIAFGVFDEVTGGSVKLMARGQITAGQAGTRPLDLNSVTESVTYSWYKDAKQSLPPANGTTQPVYPKANAYSWLKAPRYGNKPYEAGPLARMTVNQDYGRGISVLDRHLARALEARKVAQAMSNWTNQLQPSGSVYQRFTTPTTNVAGYGLTEAPRGALGHWVNLSGGKIANYQVITPTCWNASPRDGSGVRGPLEQALIGTPVGDLTEPTEVLRVVHSFDPCLSCAVHVARPKEDVRIFAIPHEA